MATTIVTKSGSGAPAASDLVAGELAVDLTNKRLYTEDSSAAIIELGTNPSGNVTFGDNGKAIFGAGSDLSLYHVGGNSYVLSNTGSLVLRSDSFRVLNAANSEQILHGDANGAVTAYYDNAVKLATSASGISVTGTVTADGLTVDGSVDAASFTSTGSTYVDINNGTVTGRLQTISSDFFIGTATAGTSLAFKSGNGVEAIRIDSSGNVNIATGSLRVASGSDEGSQLNAWSEASGEANLAAYTLKFKTGSNNSRTERMRIDSSGNVGIGTTSPDNKFHVVAGADGEVAQFTGAIETRGLSIYVETATDASALTRFRANSGGSAGQLAFNTDNNERMRIDSSGNVGIGTSSVDTKLHVRGNSTVRNTLVPSLTLDAGISAANPYTGFGTGIDFKGRDYSSVIRNYGGIYSIMVAQTASTNSAGDTGFKSGLTFHTNTGGSSGTNPTEKMRIDSDGNVGIGTDNPQASIDLKDTTPTLRLTDDRNIAWSGNETLGNIEFFNSDPSAAGAHVTGFIKNINDKVGGSVQVAGALTFGVADYNAAVSEAMRIDSVGNVGIGTISPATALEVNGDIGIGRVSGGYTFRETVGGNERASLKSNASNELIFSIYASTEAMRIDSVGNVLVGTTSTDRAASIGITLNPAGFIDISRSGTIAGRFTRKGTNGSVIDFRKESETVGSISLTGTATTYNTSSDQRLKENIADADDASSKIDAIQVRKFDWKADGSHQDYGMVAQELLEVAPEAVSQGETEDDMMGVDYSKLVPMMLKEIQSLRARIAALES